MTTAISPVRNTASPAIAGTVRTVQEFVDTLARSGIHGRRTMEEIRRRIQAGEYPSDPVRLASRLMKDGVLTQYQARCLVHGRSEGLVVGRFVILDRLGKGAMGRVFLARHRMMGRVVALKFISSQWLARPASVARFLREMRLVGRLDHPNIVRALDADQAGDAPYIIMEYVKGDDLGRKLLASGRLPVADVIRYGIEAAKGLHHAHEQGIVHRDVKPSNLLLGEDGRVRVLDLGLGILMEPDSDECAAFATADGSAVGTVEYMSPEQAAGARKVDGRSDLFSLGASMYHMITGQVPFPGDTQVESLAMRIRGRPTPIEQHGVSVPRGLAEVLDRLMGNRADDRYATGAEAAEALEALLANRSTIQPVSPLPTGSVIALPVSQLPSTDAFLVAASASPSTGITALAPPSPWLRVLSFLAEQRAEHALAAVAAALATAFVAGFGLALALTT